MSRSLDVTTATWAWKVDHPERACRALLAVFAFAAFALQNVTIIICVSAGFQKVLAFERSRAIEFRNGTATPTREIDNMWEVGLPPISFSGVFLPERYIFSCGFVLSACCMAVLVVRLYALLVHEIKLFPRENRFWCRCCRCASGESTAPRSGSADSNNIVVELLEPTRPDLDDDLLVPQSQRAVPSGHAAPPPARRGRCCSKCACAVYGWMLCGCIPMRCHNVVSLVVSLVSIGGLAGLGAVPLLTTEGARYWGTSVHGTFAACFFFGLIAEETVLLTLLLRLRRLRRGGCGFCGSRWANNSSAQRTLGERFEASCLCVKLLLALAMPFLAAVIWGCMAATLFSVDADLERRNASAVERTFAMNSAMAELQSFSAVLQWSSVVLLQLFYISAFFEFVTLGAEPTRRRNSTPDAPATVH
jgi:hypothetical protein